MKEWKKLTQDAFGRAFEKQNPNNGSQIPTDGYVSLRLETDWNPNKPTVVFTTGWNDNPWTPGRAKPLTDVLLNLYKNTANVVIVDWSTLARGKGQGWGGQQPLVEASVTKQVGDSVASYLWFAGAKDLSKVTLIGHSLGSFVMGAAANQFKILSGGKKVGELVGLDIAYGADPYDIDSSNKIVRPFTIDSNLAQKTTTYTVSDLSGITAVAGDNVAASKADRAYLVQYARTDGPYLDIGDTGAASTLYHTGVMGVYADLLAKNIKDYNSYFKINTLNKVDYSGKPNNSGPFDGVVVAAMPWTTDPGDLLFGKNTFMSPKVIGWADGYLSPAIYGSAKNDVMFFDRFDLLSDNYRKWGTLLVGGAGNDVIIAHQPDNKGIDQLYGGAGSDIFVFGFRRYGWSEKPYDDNSTSPYEWGRKGLDSYAVIEDFNPAEDRLRFAWTKKEIGYQDGSTFAPTLVNDHGKGIAIHANNDLIAYIKGINSSQAADILNNKTVYNNYLNLDTNNNVNDWDLFW